MADYEAFTRRYLFERNVRRFETMAVMDRVKIGTAIPMAAAARARQHPLLVVSQLPRGIRHGRIPALLLGWIRREFLQARADAGASAAATGSRAGFDYFNGETRGEAYRSTVNELGEAPCARACRQAPEPERRHPHLTLAGAHRPLGGRSADERLEVLR